MKNEDQVQYHFFKKAAKNIILSQQIKTNPSQNNSSQITTSKKDKPAQLIELSDQIYSESDAEEEKVPLKNEEPRKKNKSVPNNIEEFQKLFIEKVQNNPDMGSQQFIKFVFSHQPLLPQIRFNTKWCMNFFKRIKEKRLDYSKLDQKKLYYHQKKPVPKEITQTYYQMLSESQSSMNFAQSMKKKVIRKKEQSHRPLSSVKNSCTFHSRKSAKSQYTKKDQKKQLIQEQRKEEKKEQRKEDKGIEIEGNCGVEENEIDY